LVGACAYVSPRREGGIVTHHALRFRPRGLGLAPRLKRQGACGGQSHGQQQSDDGTLRAHMKIKF
jgi:hypothetical protein